MKNNEEEMKRSGGETGATNPAEETTEQTTQSGENDSPNGGVKPREMAKEIAKLREQVALLQKQNQDQELALKRQQEEFVAKLKDKAREAQLLVDEKRSELDTKFEAELEARKNKIYTKEMLGIIGAIEQFELIVQTPVSDPKVAAYVSGFKMILTMFENELTAMGFTKVQVRVGDMMDPNLMQAFEVVEVDGFESHQVVEVIRNAYKYKDTVIKHAVVKVEK